MGFFRALFDFSFTEFVPSRLIRLLYGIAVVVAAVSAVAAILRGFQAGLGAGIIALILSPLIFLLVVIIARVWLEIIIVVFRIESI
jgi:Domain of unknown function (DUF4282)